jgi:hypothetical protein
MISEKNRWLILSVLGLTCFGLFGFFNKLSTFTDAFIANLIVQFSTFAIGILFFIYLRKMKFIFSKTSLIAGICASIGTLFLLFALEANQLIIVYPFAAMAGLVFFAIFHLTHKHYYNSKQFVAVLLGLGFGVAGLAFAAIGASGGSNSAINLRFIIIGLTIMLLWGLFSYCWYKSRVLLKENIRSCLFSTAFGIILPAIVGVLIFKPLQLFSISLSLNLAYPILAGVFAAIGSLFVVSALGQITPREPTKGLVIALLTNGELIPVTILALLILHEYSAIGLVGVCVTLAGLTLLNYTEYLK